MEQINIRIPTIFWLFDEHWYLIYLQKQREKQTKKKGTYIKKWDEIKNEMQLTNLVLSFDGKFMEQFVWILAYKNIRRFAFSIRIL